MTTLTAPRPAMDLEPLTRAIVMVAGFGMSALVAIALGRTALGLAPDVSGITNLAIVIHVTTVLPCVPLGLYLLLARKGTPLHRQLGKLWVALMVVTATATLWIGGLGNFSLIHIFVPMTYRGAWLIVTTARRRDIARHRREVLGLFLGALTIPGLWALFAPGRLLNVMLLG